MAAIRPADAASAPLAPSPWLIKTEKKKNEPAQADETPRQSPLLNEFTPSFYPRIVPLSGLIGVLQAIQAHAVRDPVAATSEAACALAQFPRRHAPPLWKPATAAQEKLQKSLGYFGPQNGSRNRPHLQAQFNTRPVRTRLYSSGLDRALLTDWLLSPLDPRGMPLYSLFSHLTSHSDILRNCHDRFYRGLGEADDPFVWCPVRVPDGQPRTYGIYYTLANRIDMIERILQRTGGTYGPAYADLIELQDEYQLLSLHMELKVRGFRVLNLRVHSCMFFIICLTWCEKTDAKRSRASLPTNSYSPSIPRLACVHWRCTGRLPTFHSPVPMYPTCKHTWYISSFGATSLMYPG